MAVTDRRGATVGAADPPIATNPNPDLAWKAPARVATTGANIVLSGLQTIDAVALAAGDRVLVKDQTDQTTNGLYNAATSGWTRTIDANNNSQWTQGTSVRVTAGTVNGSSNWSLTTANPVTLGTSLMTFTEATSGLASFTGITINPNATTLSQAVSFGGSGIGNVCNLSVVNSDNLNQGANQNYDLAVLHQFGGSTVQGGRTAGLFWTRQTVATSGSNTVRNYIGLLAIGESTSGDGGTNVAAGSLGSIFAANFETRMGTGATNMFNVAGLEIDDYGATAGSQSVKYKWALSLVSFNPNQGATLDTALTIYSGGTSGAFGPGGGWGNGIMFSEVVSNGLSPVVSGATLIGTHLETLSTFNAANGVDFHQVTFSSFAFRSNGFTVDPNGLITTGKATGQNGLVQFQGSTSGFVQAVSNATGTQLNVTQPVAIGVNGTTTGSLLLLGSTSGSVQLSTPAASNGLLKFASAGSFTANGTGAAPTIGATTPAAISNTAVAFEWLTLVDNGGNTIYIPVWH